MRKSLAYWGFGICWLIGCITTVVVSKLITNRSFYFPLKFEIDPLQVISLFATVWLAFYISEVLERNSQKRSSIISLASSRVDRIIQDLSEFRRELSDLTLPNSKATSFSKLLSINQKIVVGYLSRDKRFKSHEVQSFDTDFKNHIRSIRDLLTNVPVITPLGTPNISFQNGNYIYSDSQVDLIIVDMEKLESLIVTIQRDLFDKT